MSGKARSLQFAAAVVMALVAATQAQDLLIGQVSSQTSPVTALNAKGLYAGFNVYLEHINSQGGVNGRKVRLVNKDDGVQTPKMLELTKEFAADKNVVALAASLEGFIAAKITVEAITRAGPNPTRDKVLKALNNMGQLDLGGVYVDYSPKGREGWGGVDLTIIGMNRKLLR